MAAVRDGLAEGPLDGTAVVAAALLGLAEPEGQLCPPAPPYGDGDNGAVQGMPHRAEWRTALDDALAHVESLIDADGSPRRPADFFACQPLHSRLEALLAEARREAIGASVRGARNWGASLRERTARAGLAAVLARRLRPHAYGRQDRRAAATFLPDESASASSRCFKRWKAPIAHITAQLRAGV